MARVSDSPESASIDEVVRVTQPRSSLSTRPLSVLTMSPCRETPALTVDRSPTKRWSAPGGHVVRVSRATASGSDCHELTGPSLGSARGRSCNAGRVWSGCSPRRRAQPPRRLRHPPARARHGRGHPDEGQGREAPSHHRSPHLSGPGPVRGRGHRRRRRGPGRPGPVMVMAGSAAGSPRGGNRKRYGRCCAGDCRRRAP